MLASGEEPPVAMADKRYSGTFQVRVREEVHRRLAIRAAEQGVSTNALAASWLAGADDRSRRGVDEADRCGHRLMITGKGFDLRGFPLSICGT
jgi:plasmid stability protein